MNQAPSITSIKVNTSMSGLMMPLFSTRSPIGCNSRRTKVRHTMAKKIPPPMAMRTMLQSELKLANTTASTHHAAISSMLPAANARVPSEVLVKPCSKMMRASIGKAVMAMAAPMNSTASRLEVLAANRAGSCAMK